MSLSNSELRNYVERAYHHVEGWLQRPVLWALDCICASQSRLGTSGAVCEIGVHHGRFLLALESVAPSGLPCYAMDVFDDQELNVDKSGRGAIEIFQRNVEQFAVEPTRVEAKQLDSLSAEATTFFRSIEGSVQLFSVDGGHTRLHAMRDLESAEMTLMPGGVVFLDDFFNPNWPGVVEGLFDYLRSSGTLVPVASIGGKLIMCSLSHADHYLRDLRAAALEDSELRVKWVAIRGHQYLSLR